MFKIKQRDVLGRIGRLKTPRGPSLETPYIFPVIDFLRQELPVSDIEKIGFNGVITNGYLLLRRGIKENVRKAIGASDQTIVMTDSGAYQLMEYGSVEVNNIEIVEYQKRIGSDIAVILDYPTGDSMDKNFAARTVEITLERAKEAIPFLDNNRIWVLPIQGGVHEDLLIKSVKKSNNLQLYSVYALGSPTRMLENYRYAEVMRMILTVRRIMPYDKPLHLFGAGHPMIIPFAVALGVDLFDSASYILFAREGRYMTESGTKRLEELEFFPCSCPVCTKFTPEELRNLPKKERTKFLALHNLFMLKKTLEETKQHIVEGRLWDLLRSYSKKHPSLDQAYRFLRKKSTALEKFSPSIPGSKPKSPFVMSGDTKYNPVVRNSTNRILYLMDRILGQNIIEVMIIQSCLKTNCADTIKTLIEPCIEKRDCQVLIIIEADIILPYELEKTYPLGHMTNYAVYCEYFGFPKYLEKILRKTKLKTVKFLVSSKLRNKYVEKMKKLGYKLVRAMNVNECKYENVILEFFKQN